MSKIKLFSLLVLFSLVLSSSVAVSAATIYVPDNYLTIQAAVNAASSDDTIIVRDGTYTENIEVGKDYLTIKSENGAESTIVRAANSDHHIFQVTADYVNISGFTVKDGKSGMKLHADYCTISDNNVSNNYFYGIGLDISSNSIITNNHVSNNGWGIYLGYNTPSYSSNNTITNNTVSNNNSGIYLCGSNNNISDNTLVNNGLTCGPLFAYGNSVKGNTVNGKPLVWLKDVSNFTIADAGQVILINCSNITLEYLNLFRAGLGVFLSESNNCRILNNNISNNNDYGIFLDYSDDNTVTNNNLSNNKNGIHLGYSNNNWIYLNNYIDNGDNVYSYESSNIWNSPDKITYTYNANTYTNYLGNYWSDYTGSDIDGNGIGDTPYGIDPDEDSYPLMKPFENYILTPIEAIQDLAESVEELDLPQETVDSLTDKLEAAIDSLNRGRDNAAINQLNAFINQIEALRRSGRLTDKETYELIASAQEIIDNIEAGTGNSATSSTEETQFQTESPPTKKTELSQNYPNPFNPQTTIEYDIEKDCDVNLKIYNLAGQLIKTLVDEYQTAGHYTITWYGDTNAGGEVASGVYFYHIKAGDFVSTKKMVVLK